MANHGWQFAVMGDGGAPIAYVNGRCPHLLMTGQCAVYEARPKGCREFDCSVDHRALFREQHPHVAALLESGHAD